MSEKKNKKETIPFLCKKGSDEKTVVPSVSYGMAIMLKWEEEDGMERLIKAETVTGFKKYCKNRFDILIKKGEVLEIGKKIERVFNPENPRYVDGCTSVKTFVVDISDAVKKLQTFTKIKMITTIGLLGLEVEFDF